MNNSMPLCASGDGVESLNLLGLPTKILVRSADTGGAWFLFEQTVPPGQGVPPHVHSREDEIFFVLEGTVAFFFGGERINAKAGDVFHAPRNAPHGYEATGDAPATIRFMAMPGGLEEMFVEMAGWPPDEGPDMAKLAELCGRFGIQFV